MDSYDVSFIESIPCGAEIAAFRFSKPDGYRFAPGQYLTLTLATEQGPETKPFTHSAAPDDPYLEITTRLSGSSFKNALRGLERGASVRIAGPAGRLVLPEGTTRIAFLVGGVGITPVRSMLRDAVHRGFAWDDATVFFGNRDPSCLPYVDELDAMSDRGVRVVNVVEHPDGSWTGPVGFITADLVRQYIDPADGRIFLTSGPPPMVEAMVRVMDALDIGEDRRMVERFGGPVDVKP